MAEQPPHVLVINDEQEMLLIMRELLEEEGYRVTTQTYPVIDHGELRLLAPDLIVLDMVFGGETIGWQALQRLRLNRDIASIPMIVCTGAVHLITDAHEHLKHMGVGVVLKPFDIDHLLDEIRRQLERERPIA